jgi:O-antigen ligase
MIGILLLVGACLLVTKSRSGYVAAFVGVIALSVWKEIRSGRRQWLMGIGIGLVLLVSMILLSVQLGLLDVQVLTEARKSLGYRWEYWTSTVALIADHPLWGVGAGNFQDFYARYKLPQASEMVADPHNFLLEIAAIAGLPTLVIWLVTLTVWSWQVIRRGSESVEVLINRFLNHLIR